MASSAKLMRSCSESNLTRNNVSSSKKDLGIAKSSSLSELQQRPSHLRASPSYSFGAPRHGTGKFKVPCPLAHSRASYVETLHSVACNIPGPGSYDRATCIGLGGSQMDKVAPRFSFGNSRLPRFYHQTRRHSLLYHCQAYPTGQDTSAEGPGVGHYFGGDKHLPVQCKTSPVYSLGDRRVNYHMNCKGYWWRPTPGANAYKVEDKRYCEDFNNLVKSPSFTIGKEKGREKGEALINSTATNADVGPGKYKLPSYCHSELILFFSSFTVDPTFCVVEEVDDLGHRRATRLIYHRAKVIPDSTVEEVASSKRSKHRVKQGARSFPDEKVSQFRTATCPITHDEQTSTAELHHSYIWMLDLLTNIRSTVALNKLHGSQSYTLEPLPGKRMILKLMKPVPLAQKSINFLSHKPDVMALVRPHTISGRVIVTERLKPDVYVKFNGLWFEQNQNFPLQFIDPQSSVIGGVAYVYRIKETALKEEHVVILERDMGFSVLRQNDTKFGEEYGWEIPPRDEFAQPTGDDIASFDNANDAGYKGGRLYESWEIISQDVP